ncbi:Protein CBG10637 [Caenorhabditis briggsae]|uniref:Protein CBG10637 n=1 Tax=Caenorhabditis briggsae TaxID=6238 RepID=A8XBI0_CAEBR|nr:Protein CBG10637 [Caenorhabditis briggsae]CAP29995.1 Protein CBG10637 [Caenorhabditis briggsae]
MAELLSTCTSIHLIQLDSIANIDPAYIPPLRQQHEEAMMENLERAEMGFGWAARRKVYIVPAQQKGDVKEILRNVPEVQARVLGEEITSGEITKQ